MPPASTARAAQTARMVSEPPLMPPAALSWAALDALQDGLAVHGMDGRQVHANAALRGLAEVQDGFAWHPSGAALPSEAPALRRLDRALCAAACGTPVAMALPRPSGAAAYLLRCTPMPGHAGWSVLRVTDPGARHGVPPLAFLRAAYQLTEAEARLAMSLCAGASVIDYARARDISVHTVRTQMRAVLLKTGVDRQVDLIGLLTALAR